MNIKLKSILHSKFTEAIPACVLSCSFVSNNNPMDCSPLQAPLSMEFPNKTGMGISSLGIFPTQGKGRSPVSPCTGRQTLPTTEQLGKPTMRQRCLKNDTPCTNEREINVLIKLKYISAI